MLSALVLLFGGGGAEGAHHNAIIAAVGAFALAGVCVGSSSAGSSLRFTENWWLVFMGVGLLALPLIQLIPLPPGLWQHLAGREPVANTLNLIGVAANWRPLSLSPDATMRAATFLTFPLAAFLAASLGDKTSHRNFVYVLASCAGVSAFIGAAQLALGHPGWLSFYDGPSFGAASGIFANPNHQALFMAFGLVACAIIIRDKSTSKRGSSARHPYEPTTVAAWAGLLFFSFMTLASGARAGVMLLSIGLPGSLLIAKGKTSVLRWAGLMLGILALLGMSILLYPSTNSLGVRENFRLGEDARYAYLPDILYTLSQYWTAGSGLGSFVSVFTPNESLELAGRAYLNHAHNDFLEWTIETGMLGIAWLSISVLLVSYLAWRRLRSRAPDIGLTMGALLLVTLAGLHSLADYPLRTATLATVFAFAMGLLCAEPTRVAREHSGGRGGIAHPRWLVAAMFILATPLAILALISHLSAHAIRSGDFAAASALDRNNPRVLINQSEIALREKRHVVAESLAVRAVIHNPLSAPALRQLALAREAQGRAANNIWQAASALGWRDGPTQLWAFRQALLGNQLDIAAVRADAVLRTKKADPGLLSVIRSAARNPALAREIAGRVRMDPPWRAAFFILPPKPSLPEVAGVTEVLRQLAHSKEANRRDARSLISHLIVQKQWVTARAIYDAVVFRNSDSLALDDGGFDRTIEEYERDATAFDWQGLKSVHVSGNIETLPPSRLVLDSDGEAKAVGAQRYLALNPGIFGLSFVSRSDSADSFQIRILCANSSKEVAKRVIRRTTSFEANVVDFEVGLDCPLVRLVLESLPRGRPATAEFDNFKIEHS